MDRVCDRCNLAKSVGDFHWTKERAEPRKICKECHRKACRENYAANRTRILEQHKQRASLPEVRERQNEIARKNRHLPHNRKRVRKYCDLYNERHPEKYAAKLAVRWAIKRGDIVRPDRCGKCATIGQVQAHHHDYTKPLDVEWLCQKCHTTEHRSQPITDADIAAAIEGAK